MFCFWAYVSGYLPFMSSDLFIKLCLLACRPCCNLYVINNNKALNHSPSRLPLCQRYALELPAHFPGSICMALIVHRFPLIPIPLLSFSCLLYHNSVHPPLSTASILSDSISVDIAQSTATLIHRPARCLAHFIHLQ